VVQGFKKKRIQFFQSAFLDATAPVQHKSITVTVKVMFFSQDFVNTFKVEFSSILAYGGPLQNKKTLELIRTKICCIL